MYVDIKNIFRIKCCYKENGICIDLNVFVIFFIIDK